MSLRTVNLNLLPVLRALLRERSLSKAAIAVGLSQPAVSAALTRLRVIYGDPLLVRQGRGMMLTLRARELIEPVETTCAALEDLIGGGSFDPAVSKRRFVICSADYAVVTLGATLIAELGARAPHMSIHFVDVPQPHLGASSKEVDLWLIPGRLLGELRDPALRWVPLIEDEYVTVVGPDHRLAHVERPSIDELLAERYVLYYPALSPIATDDAVGYLGVRRQYDIAAQIQQMSLLGPLAMDTGCAAIVPRRVVTYLQRFMPLKIVEGGPAQVPLEVAIAWNVMHDRDPAHRWLRQLLIDRFSMLPAASLPQPLRRIGID